MRISINGNVVAGPRSKKPSCLVTVSAFVDPKNERNPDAVTLVYTGERADGRSRWKCTKRNSDGAIVSAKVPKHLKKALRGEFVEETE